MSADPNTTVATAEDDAPVLRRRGMNADAEVDMTPMIDCVFLLNIFFILTFNADPSRAKNLAPAVTGEPLDPRTAVIITMVEGPAGAPLIYLGENRQGAPLPADENSQREQVVKHLQDGLSQGKVLLAIQAERGIKCSDVNRIAAMVHEVEGMSLTFTTEEMEP